MSIFGDIGDFLVDAANTAGGIVTAPAKLFDGPGAIAGVVWSGTQLFISGPQVLIPVIIQGFVISEAVNAIIRNRRMNDEERFLAQMIFGNSLPDHDRIVLTNMWHPEGRAFTIPNAAGEILINLGDHFDHPLEPAGDYAEHGQLFIHELTHAWQIHHDRFVPGLICEASITQIRHSLGDDQYKVSELTNPWDSYGTEQQATLIDLWYAGKGGKDSLPACSRQHPAFPHVVHVNGGDPPVVGPLSLRDVAKRRLGIVSGFSVRDTFKRQITGRLRKRMIGLHG